MTPTCFVIAPFKAPYSGYYENILKPAVTAEGLEPVRGDEFNSITPVMEDIWKSIVNCQICLADLSENNPNVLFEVGLAMAIDKPIVIVTQNANNLPFDLKANRVIEYHPTAEGDWENRFRQKLSATLQDLVRKNTAVQRPTWKTIKTAAETVYDNSSQQVRERSNIIDINDVLQPAYADQFFVTPPESENSLIKNAKSELWLVYETGSLVLQHNFGIIVQFLKAGGKLRLLLVSQKIHEMVILRHRFRTSQYLPGRYEMTHTYLDQIVTEAALEPHSAQLSVRWLHFPVNFVGVFIEPNAAVEHEQYAVVRLLGFRTFIERERSMVMRADISKDTFDYYLDQFNQMWEAASTEE